ncbi:Lnb N-terminal periplasmic domain-containing protein [Halomonas faecis]|uniref:Lnb N-terminal periplasmic domain-containing protein n=1 Tax=Halomonas faecis TaxID=1562110 RepID=UPI0013D3B8EC|nr:DUF4105 domain-containing protein [Halomonas faecis]
MVLAIAWSTFFTLLTLSMTWGAAALWFRLSLPTPWRQLTLVLWAVMALGLVTLGFQGHRGSALGGQIALLAVLSLWWFRLRPTHDRPWADDVLHLATGRVTEGQLTLDRVRHFEWQTRDRARVHWEPRHYDLARLDSADLIVSSWGRPGIAHVMVSFGFGGETFVVFSVEVRRQKGERFSEIGGFFRQYELAIVAADERDAVRLRSNVRGETVWLYRLDMSRHAIRSLLLAYVDEANRLAREPRFYNTITANCTTLVFAMARRLGAVLPIDHRLLLTAKLPEYAYRVGGLWPGYNLKALQYRGNIVERARAADGDPAFSQRIREGVPGWGTPSGEEDSTSEPLGR